MPLSLADAETGDLARQVATVTGESSIGRIPAGSVATKRLARSFGTALGERYATDRALWR